MTKTVKTDARARALRTLLQGFVFSVAAALVVALYGVVTSAGDWGDVVASVTAWSFTQSIVTAGLSWLLRAVVEPWRAGQRDAGEDGAA